MSESLDIPDSWLHLTLGEVIDYGRTTKVEPSEISSDSWVLELEDIEKDTSRVSQRLSFAQRQSKSTKNRFSVGDVLYGKLRPYLNKVLLAARDGYCSTEILPLTPNQSIDGRFLFYWLKHPQFLKYAESASHGLNMPRLGTEAGQQAPFVLAPLDEQKRIADKLDELFGRIDACRDRLDRVPLILKRFQEAVLNAATSGQLTEDWWEKDISAEPTSTLLTRIEEERKQSYGGRYQEPLLPKGSVLEYLPQSWSLVTLDQISLLVTSGSRGWAKYYSHSGAYFIRTQNINNDQLNLDDVAYVNLPDGSEGERTRLQLGDLLITITGANVTKSALINSELPEAYVNQHLGLVRLVPSVCWEFIHLWIISPKHGRAQLTEAAYGNGKPGLNLTNLRQVLIALPPLKEQQEIVRRVKTLFAYADRLRSRYQNACVQVDRLTPALLDKAFRGELVAQDSNDEPASILLDHIRTEQAAQPTKPRRVLTDRKPNMTKTTEEFVKEVIRQMPQDTFSFDELRAKLSGDYDSLKDILFNLLDKSEPSIVQVFDQEAEAMRFVRGDK